MAELDPAMRLLESTHRYCFGEGELIIQFSGDGLNSSYDCIAAVLSHNPIPIISKITSPIRLIFETKGPDIVRMVAEFTPSESLMILGGEPPNERNLRNILKSIQDQTAYPMPGSDPGWH